MKRRLGGDNAARLAHHRPHNFMFATGIENSYPVVTGRDGRDLRVDEMAKCRHYERWREDFHLVKELGLEYLRYGPPYYRDHLGPGRYDWDFADETFAELRRLGIYPIVDLCHFGVPDWAGNFQNPDWPKLFAEYAAAFLDVQPNALFIQSESTEYFHAVDPAAQSRAAAYNDRRFLSLDLSYGHDVRGMMYEYLMDNGMTRKEHHWFLRE